MITFDDKFQIGSFFMINLCLVVIATQFAETKKREMERMRQERARFNSTSTLASSTNNSEPATCYAEIVKYIAHLWRRFKRRLIKKIRSKLLPIVDYAVPRSIFECRSLSAAFCARKTTERGLKHQALVYFAFRDNGA